MFLYMLTGIIPKYQQDGCVGIVPVKIYGNIEGVVLDENRHLYKIPG